MSKMPRVLLGCIVAVALSSMGCRKLVQAALRGRDAGAGSTATASREEDTDHDRLGAKLQNYIGCYNEVDMEIGRTMSRYKSWMEDPKKGPTGKERNAYGPSALSATDLDTCKKGIAAGVKQKPALAQLEKAGQDYLVALEALAPKMAEAAKYYDRKDYADDKFAKAISMHGPLMAAYENFAKVSDVFSDVIEEENGKFLEEELKQVEATIGKKLLWHKMTLGRDAKELLHVLGKENFDVAKAEKLVATFTTHVDATVEYASTHKDEQPIMWSVYEMRAKSVVDAYKERMRHVRDKRSFNNGEQMMIRNGHGENVGGTMAKCSKTYNELVNSGNSLKFK
jgi:hypothetical protein